MMAFIILLLAAAVAHGIAVWTRLPVIPLYLVAGYAVRLWFGEHEGDALWINAVELGLVFLVFTVGVELNPKRLAKQIRAVWWVGIVQFLLLGALGFGISKALGYTAVEAVYITFALSASSTLVVIRLLKQRQQMFEPYGRLVSGVLLLQDVFIMLVLVVLLRIDQGTGAILLGLGQSVALGGLAWIAHRWVAPWLLVRVRQDEETLLLSILSVLFVFLGFAWFLDLPFAVGAFLGGFVLSVFPVNGITRGMLSSLSAFFFGLFFTALGALLVMPPIEIWLHALVFALFLIGVTVPLVTVVAELCGVSAKSAIESGLLLSQTSEFSLILMLQGWVLLHVSHDLFSMVIVLTVGTMALTPFLSHERVAHFLMRLHPVGGSWWGLPDTTEGHVVMLGYGSSGDYIASPIAEAGRKVVVVDEDASVVLRLNRKGLLAIRGDASNPSVLERVFVERASLVMVGVRRFSDTEKILHQLSQVKGEVWVRVFDADQGRRVEALGARAIVGVDPAVQTFREWFGKRFVEGDSN